MERSKDRPSCRWTRDTETAFLLALRSGGSVAAACRVIGRSAHGANDRRRRLPDFAERWAAALAEHLRERVEADTARRRAAGEIPPAGAGGDGWGGDGDDPGGSDESFGNRSRYDGFTPLRQRAYLRALTETGEYEAAARKVGVSARAARVLRRRFPAFAAACERALARSAGTLEQIAFERATQGWEEPIVHAGKVVGTRRRYSDALLRQLLQQEAKRGAARAEAERAAATAPAPRMSTEEVNVLLERKLAALGRQVRAEERERAIVWADEMVRRGLAP